MILKNINSLKIAVNTRFLIKDKLEGIGWFSYNILKLLVENNPQHTFYFIFDRAYHPDFLFGPNVIPIIINPPARHPFLWYIWFEFAIPITIRKINPDVFLSLDSFTSISSKVKKVTVIHDIAFQLFDNQVPKIPQMYMRYFTPKFIYSSDKIVTVSNATKHDLMHVYGVSSDKIQVSNNAASEVFRPMTETEKIAFKMANSDNVDYILYIGSIHPRKNILNLLKAFELFKMNTKSQIQLIIIGRMAWATDEVTTYYQTMQYQSDIKFISHSSQSMLSKWLGAAISLIYIPFYEGFGIPLVEAMHTETAIITSNISSMPEVVEDCAILVDPYSIYDISEAIFSIVNDTERRALLIEKGKKRRECYTWEHAADVVWKSIIDTIDS